MPAHIEGIRHGITHVHDEKYQNYRRIEPVPAAFSVPEHTGVTTFDVEGSRELSVDEFHYILNGITTFALNTFFALAVDLDDRTEFVPAGKFYKYHEMVNDTPLNPTQLGRAFEAFDSMSVELFGEPNRILERSARGSGTHPVYRIRPNIVFRDLRDQGDD